MPFENLLSDLKFRLFGVAFTTALLVCSPARADGPFGISKGDAISTLEGCVPAKSGMWRCAKVPRPHSAFKSYVVQAHPTTGICFVKGITDIINSDAFGMALKSKFDDILGQLKSVYGEGELTDLLIPGSIWKDPNDWMMATLKHERFQVYSWKTTASKPLKNSIRAISLGISAVSSDSGFVAVEYAFDNEPECDKAIKGDEKDAL